MKLLELKQIIERAENLGFKDDEIEVTFKKGFTIMVVGKSEVCVEASARGAKPTLTINLSEPYVGGYMDR